MDKLSYKLFSLVLVFAFMTLTTFPVSADSGSGGADWSNFFDADGNLQPGVVDAGEIEVQAEWMSTIGTNGTYQNNPTFHQYVAANGDTILAPSNSTMLAMIENSETSGLLNAEGMYQAIGRGNLTSVLDVIAESPELQALFSGSYITTDAGFFSSGSTGVVGEDRPSAWAIIQRLVETGLQDFALPFTYLYYSADGCETSPVGCQGICEIVPDVCLAPVADDPSPAPITPPSCPASTIVLGMPTLTIAKIAPLSPLVVGQDPDKRGADVKFSAIIPPTVYTYYVPVPIYEDAQVCMPNENGSIPVGANCMSGTLTTVNNGILLNVRRLVRVDCVRHINYYAEQIGGVNATANLSQDSINWINNELSEYYYEAHTVQESFNLVPGLALANAYCDASKTCFASGTVEKIQFRDPGDYGLGLSVSTMGTLVTTGRILRAAGDLTVSFIAVRLIETGSN
jgi:hypothetical protein